MTSLNYQRTDFAQVGTTNRGCMRIVPGDLKKQQLDRIAVGGQNGCVICLVRKNNDTQKGKIFFSFDTNMAESIKRMYVYGVDLVLTGQKSYNHYRDCADSNYVLSSEDIYDVVSLEQDGAWGSRPFTSVLACRDATLKIVEGSSVAYELELTDVPLTLQLFNGDGGYMKNEVLYGTKGGKLGLARVPEKKGQIVWEITTTTASAVTCMTTYNLFGNQLRDIIVGKEDGIIEIYVPEEEQVQLRGTYQCEESITSLGCGRVADENEDEIIVCTYTGWIFSLSQSSSAATAASAPALGSGVNVKVQQLKSEIEELEAKVSEERKRYEDMTKKDVNKLAFVPHFQVLDHFEFNQEYGAYSLVIELVIPIDFIIVQSKLPIHLMEVEKNTSVVCQIPKSDTNPWPLLASYRCQANTSRLELRVRIEEGQFGNLIIYVCPKIHPKMVQMQSYQVRPLSAHTRVHSIDAAVPMSTLSFTGTFTISEAHAWLTLLVPGVPVKCPPADTVTNYYQCAINGGTQLQVTYMKGSIVFKSDSLSTIVTIRDRISDETTQKQIRVQISCDINDASVEHCLRLMHPRINHLLNLEKRKHYAAALKELEANSDEISFLSEENIRILEDHDKIYEEAEKESLEDSGILTIYEKLLVDRARLHGNNERGRLQALRDLLLTNYSLDEVIKFFKSTNDYSLR